MFALCGAGARRELQLESFWPHGPHYVLKFEGVDSISDAETLVGCELQVAAQERAELESGSAYVSDLVGCTVIAVGAPGQPDSEVGQVAHVQFGAGEAPLLIVRHGDAEYMLPFAAEYLDIVDVAQKRIRMRLPEGMLDINGPLTDEEKRMQSGGEVRRGPQRRR